MLIASVLAIVLQTSSPPTPTPAETPAHWASGLTLRFDYYHAGTASEEHIAPDRYRLEPRHGPLQDWPTDPRRLIDTTNLGKYLFEVVDRETNQILYSRGFSSIYGEWETTGEAKKAWRSFHESQRFPEPKTEVQLVLKKRADDGSFREIWSDVLDPASRFVDRSPIVARGTVEDVGPTGPPSEQVDLLIVAEGYTAEQRMKFHEDALRLSEVMFSTEPFMRRKGDFNVRLLVRPLTGRRDPESAQERVAAHEPSASRSTPSTATATCSRTRMRPCAKLPRKRPTTR